MVKGKTVSDIKKDVLNQILYLCKKNKIGIAIKETCALLVMETGYSMETIRSLFDVLEAANQIIIMDNTAVITKVGLTTITSFQNKKNELIGEPTEPIEPVSTDEELTEEEKNILGEK